MAHSFNGKSLDQSAGQLSWIWSELPVHFFRNLDTHLASSSNFIVSQIGRGQQRLPSWCRRPNRAKEDQCANSERDADLTTIMSRLEHIPTH